MCIFCKSDDTIETDDNDSTMIECMNCNSKIRKKNTLHIINYPKGSNYVKYLWIMLLTFPIWFFVFGLVVLIEKIFGIKITIPLFVLIGGLMPACLSILFWQIENLHNYIKNGYMIFGGIITTKDDNIISKIIDFLLTVISLSVVFLGIYFFLSLICA
jgi:hypothetical protein